MRASTRGFTLIELLIVVAIIGILAAIAIPNLMNAVDKSKQRRTMSDIRSIGTAVESYAVDNAGYPTVATMPALKAVVDPIFFDTMPLVDGWSHAYQIDAAFTAYTIFSQGKDAAGTTCTPAVITTFIDQICFINGRFSRYPEGTQQ